MKKSVLPILAALALAVACKKTAPATDRPLAGAPTATAATATTADDTQSAILAADDRWRAGILHSDRAALEKVVALEFTLSGAFGTVPRQAWMENSLLWQTRSVDWRGAPHVDVFGDAAVLRGTLHWHVIKDKPDPRTGTAELDLDFIVTDVWIRRAGQWQVVARHSTIPLKP